MTFLQLAPLFVLTLTTSHSQVDPSDPRLDGPAPNPEVALPLGTASSAFGLDLYRSLSAAEGNLLVSPYSISLAMAMSQEGARGATLEQMRAALRLPEGVSTDGYRDLGVLVESSAKKTEHHVPFELSVANRLWVDERLPLDTTFEQRMASIFGAPVESADFGKPELVRKEINDWAELRTKGRVKDIVPEGLPSPQSALALANAVYFKARWHETFAKGATEDAPFYRDGESAVDVPLMHQVDRFRYAETSDAQWLELPYMGGDASMTVVLPRDRDGLAQFESSLDMELFEAGLNGLASRRVDVCLPRFGFETSLRLKDTLVALGMSDAFSQARADFSGISTAEKLWLDAVLHKSFIAVDEDGTEAAAVTVAIMTRAAMDPSPPVAFVANHPFLFFIRHRSTGAMLFMGRVVDPSAE